MEKRYNKKGQIGAVGAMIGLVVGVGIATLILIFIGALGGQTYNLVEDNVNNIAGTVTNESVTLVNGTLVTLSNNAIDSTTFKLFNQTAFIGSGNYSLDAARGKIFLTNSQYAGQAFINYSHGTQSIENSVKAGITSAFEAQEQTGQYVPLIVLAVVIGIVLTIVLGISAFSGQGGNSVL